MSSSPACACTPACGDPAGDPAAGGHPFTRLRFQDGVLLDADDLRTDQNGHVWRDRLHAALLHGAGTVWGLAVARSDDGRWLRVRPGLAVDARGRNLWLDQELCLDLRGASGAFWESLPEVSPGVRRACVVLTYEACASEPATGLRPGCAEAPPTGGWARQHDRARVDLAAAPPEEPIATLRRWLGRLAAAPATGPGRWLGGEPAASSIRPLLLEVLTADATGLDDLWATDEDLPLLLATVDLEAAPNAGLRAVADPDPRGRALLPGVQLLGELLLGTSLAGSAATPAAPVRVEAFEVAGGVATVRTSQPLDPTTVVAGSVELLARVGGAWTAVPVDVAVAGNDLTVTPTSPPAAGTTVQLRVAGTGPFAVLGAGGAFFAGDAGPTLLPCARDLVLVAIWS